jgi:hypothetical protein
VVERDSLASRLALAEAEVEKLRAAAASAEEAAERSRTAASTTETATRDVAQAAAHEKATLKARVSELERDLALPRWIWQPPAASSPRPPISFTRSPRRRRGCARATSSCLRTSRVSCVVAFFLRLFRCSLLVEF